MNVLSTTLRFSCRWGHECDRTHLRLILRTLLRCSGLRLLLVLKPLLEFQQLQQTLLTDVSGGAHRCGALVTTLTSGVVGEASPESERDSDESA